MILKIPTGLFRLSTKDVRLYCAYLDFKAFNSEGHICPPYARDRFYYTYWRKKLIAKGWAIEKGKCIALVSYQQVWKDMGVKPSWNKRQKRYRFPYRKVQPENLPEERKEYFKALQQVVFARIAGNKVRQIKWRLKSKQVNTKTETFISSRTVARLVGLNSPASGSKYRKQLFQVIPEPTQQVKTGYGYRYKCKKIAL